MRQGIHDSATAQDTSITSNSATRAALNDSKGGQILATSNPTVRVHGEFLKEAEVMYLHTCPRRHHACLYLFFWPRQPAPRTHGATIRHLGTIELGPWCAVLVFISRTYIHVTEYSVLYYPPSGSRALAFRSGHVQIGSSETP